MEYKMVSQIMHIFNTMTKSERLQFLLIRNSFYRGCIFIFKLEEWKILYLCFFVFRVSCHGDVL